MERTSPSTNPSSSKRIYKVVLTGGPCGGKTTGQSRLCTFFENLGWKVYRVPETATILLSGGIKFADLSPEEATKFQENLLLTIMQLEQVYFELAASSRRNCLIICDRGTFDASAFISPQAWDRIMIDNDFNPVQLRDNRYNHIIHMVSAAIEAEAFYSTEDHLTRSENIELARELDRKAGQAWIGHPYFDIIDNNSNFETKIMRMISMVCQKLGIDTGDRLRTNARKMKYLVHGPLPAAQTFPKFQDFTVEHIYLRTNSRKMQARVRKRGANGNHSYTYTIRKPEKLGQIVEVRTQVTQRDWNTAKGQADDEHFIIYKTRRCFLHNDQYFQLDIYREPCHDRCNGLMLLETYSTLTGEEMKKRLPCFLDVNREVTGNPEFSMYNLSLKEEWSNSKKFCVNIAGKDAAKSAPTDQPAVVNGDDDHPILNDIVALKLELDEQVQVGGGSSIQEGVVESLNVCEVEDENLVVAVQGDAVIRRPSECDTEWAYYQKKMVLSTTPEDEEKISQANGEDDKFYEDMDRRYNGTRKPIKEEDGTAAAATTNGGTSSSSDSDSSQEVGNGGNLLDSSDNGNAISPTVVKANTNCCVGKSSDFKTVSNVSNGSDGSSSSSSGSSSMTNGSSNGQQQQPAVRI